jgi:putative FmdB family regulatory protein
MPLYEYQCDACGHRFEVIQKFSDAPIAVCPKCGGAVQKLLSSPAIQFKGSGWYITDYARAGKSDGNSGAKSPGKSDGKSEGKAEGSSESSAASDQSKSDSGDSKSAAKAESKSESKSDAKPTSSSSSS